MIKTLNSRKNAADICRANEWGAGTLLRGTEFYGEGKSNTCELLITAVGEKTILGRCLLCCTSEGCWTLNCREWVEIPRSAAARS